MLNDNVTSSELRESLRQAFEFRAVDSREAMQAIVRYDGDIDAAAVSLATRREAILAAIILDPANHNLLSQYFRMYQSLKLFTLIGDLTDLIKPELEELSPKEKAKTLGVLVGLFEQFTTPQVSSAPSQDPKGFLKLLPPHVQQAFAKLQTPLDISPNEDVA